jgi:hypothetical protein
MVEILAQPPSTGDLGTLTISRDKDLDGHFDEALSVPQPVSGICANGIIACDAGTWNNCHTYRWTVGSGNDLKLAEVDLTSLAACYCINASCGSNLAWTNLATVLKDIGGGVVGALTTADPRIAVTRSRSMAPSFAIPARRPPLAPPRPPCRSHPMPAMPPASVAMRQRLRRPVPSFRRSPDRQQASGKARNCAIAL